jgi:hypothetical protein
MNPVRNDDATMACAACGAAFVRSGRRRHCSDACRQAAWRRRSQAPVAPLVAKPGTVYQCPTCEARYLGEQRCEDCNSWARRLGPSGPCPSCEEAIAITELLGPEHFAGRPPATTTGRR